MNSLTRKNKVIKAVALFLVFTLLIGFVDLSSVIAVSQEDLLDYSYLSTQNQMVSEAENITISDINTEERIQNFNQNWKFNDGDDSLAYTDNFNDSSWQTVNIPHNYSITKINNSSRETERLDIVRKDRTKADESND